MIILVHLAFLHILIGIITVHKAVILLLGYNTADPSQGGQVKELIIIPVFVFPGEKSGVFDIGWGGEPYKTLGELSIVLCCSGQGPGSPVTTLINKEHTDLSHGDFLHVAAQDPGLKEVYRDDQAVVFEVITQ